MGPPGVVCGENRERRSRAQTNKRGHRGGQYTATIERVEAEATQINEATGGQYGDNRERSALQINGAARGAVRRQKREKKLMLYK